MSKKQDFVKFYMDKRDKEGCVNFKDLEEFFKLENSQLKTPYMFVDKNGLNYVKRIRSKCELDAEMLFPRVYKKVGFNSAMYYPVKTSLDEKFFAVSPSIKGNVFQASKLPDYFIFKKYGNVFLSKNPLLTGEDELTGDFSQKAIRDLLLMRVLDTASFNCDRHKSNYFYHLKDDERVVSVIDGITTIDYANSGWIALNCNLNNFYNNFMTNGDSSHLCSSKREDMVEEFRENETVQQFLPHCEAGEILGSIDLCKEAETLKEETNYQVDGHLLDLWAKSFDQMAEELEQ